MNAVLLFLTYCLSVFLLLDREGHYRNSGSAAHSELSSRVRLLTDESWAVKSCSQVRALHATGIDVRFSHCIMRNKFCLVDGLIDLTGNVDVVAYC